MQPLAFIQNLSSWEIILIFLVVLLFFGAKRLPELFRSFGKSIREFKKATTDIEQDIRSAMEEEPDEKPRRTERPAKTEPITEPQKVDSESERETDEDSTPKADNNDDSETKKSESTSKA